MINSPYTVGPMSRIMPEPGRTSQNNFQSFQQPRTFGQQMQTPACAVCSGNPQDPNKQSQCYHFLRGEAPIGNYQHAWNTFPANPWQPDLQPPCNVPSANQSRPTYESLPQNILEQIRSCVSNAAPIFILPGGGCHRSNGHQETPTFPGSSERTNQSPGFQCQPTPPAYWPPPFYPYPVPLPVYERVPGQRGFRDRTQDCCCSKPNDPRIQDPRSVHGSTCYPELDSSEHRCTGDAICSRADCPSSVALQALVSQLLSVPGIISCAATRLILKRIPNSSVATTTEETMDRALKSIEALTKDQLLAESRIGQQATLMIDHHMTASPPANVVPILTLVQLKVNLLRARVNDLINRKIMECQGCSPELDTADGIDPAILRAKSDSELRELLAALRQRECDERVNVNFAPYRSQRAIAESRLSLVQKKARQVEAELERRRSLLNAAGPTLTSRIVNQFSESYCTYGMIDSRLFETDRPRESPDPFTVRFRSPRRLSLKPHVGSPETTYEVPVGRGTTEKGTCTEPCKDDKGTGAPGSDADRGGGSSADDCSYCDRSSSEDSLREDKKKLQPRVDGAADARPNNGRGIEDRSPPRLPSCVNPGLAVDEGRLVAERDEPREEAGETQTERSSVYIEVRPDKRSSLLYRIPSDNNSASTIRDGIGIDSPRFRKTKRRTEDKGNGANGGSTGGGGRSGCTDGYESVKFEISSADGVGFEAGRGLDSGRSVGGEGGLRKLGPGARKERSFVTGASNNVQFPAERVNQSDVDDSAELQLEAGAEGAEEEEEEEEAVYIAEAETVITDELANESERSRHAGFAVKEIETGVRSNGNALSPWETEERKTTARGSFGSPQEPGQEPSGTVDATGVERESAETYTSSIQIKFRPGKNTGREKQRSGPVNKTDPAATSLINKNREPFGDATVGEREETVSMLTSVRYDSYFADCREWRNLSERFSPDLKTTSLSNKVIYPSGGGYGFWEIADAENTSLESFQHRDTLPGKINRSKVALDRKPGARSTFNITDEARCESRGTLSSGEQREEKSAGRERTEFDQESEHRGFGREGSQRNESSSGTVGRLWDRCGTIETAGCVFQAGKQRSSSCDLFRCVEKTQENFLSVICSAIGDRLALLGSFMTGVLAQNISPGLTWKMFCRDEFTEAEGAMSRIKGRRDRKRVPLQKRNPLRGSVTGRCNKVHSAGHTIIVDKEKENYKVIGGLIRSSEQREPYKTRRTFLIRSRLKSDETCSGGNLQPFMVLRRARRSTVLGSQRAVSRSYGNKEYELKRSEKFWSLPVVEEKNGEVSELMSLRNRTNRGSDSFPCNDEIARAAKHARSEQSLKSRKRDWRDWSAVAADQPMRCDPIPKEGPMNVNDD